MSLEKAALRHREYYFRVAQQSVNDWQVIENEFNQLEHAWHEIAETDSEILYRWTTALSDFSPLRGYWEANQRLLEKTLSSVRLEPVMNYRVNWRDGQKSLSQRRE